MSKSVPLLAHSLILWCLGLQALGPTQENCDADMLPASVNPSSCGSRTAVACAVKYMLAIAIVFYADCELPFFLLTSGILVLNISNFYSLSPCIAFYSVGVFFFSCIFLGLLSDTGAGSSLSDLCCVAVVKCMFSAEQTFFH